MKVAAFQAPLSGMTVGEVLASIGRCVDECDAEGVPILCCPEAVVGGLADHARDPFHAAIPTSDVLACLAPLNRGNVTTIVGFTELSNDGSLYNSAAVVSGGTLMGVYRKRHPAIRQSVCRPGEGSPVFRTAEVCFGILICYDSTFRHLGTELASRGAQVIFVPTNNAMPSSTSSTELLAETKACDFALATETGCWIVRADVAGIANGLRSDGSTAITSPAGQTVSSARMLTEDLLIAEIG